LQFGCQGKNRISSSIWRDIAAADAVL
jgi:hypothetical protein